MTTATLKLNENTVAPVATASYIQIYAMTDNTIHALLPNGTDIVIYSPSIPPATSLIALASAYG